MGTSDDGFSAFFAAEAERLRRLAFFLTGDLERAADLAQDALAAAFRHWRRIKGDPGPYTRRTLVNLCRNAHRRRVLERRHAASTGNEAHAYGDRVEDAMRVVAALKVLSPIQRATVVLRYYEDLPEAEIASILGRPLGTVKSDLFRSLQRLRPELDEREVS